MFTETHSYGTGYFSNTGFRPLQVTFAREPMKTGNEWHTHGGLVSVAAVSGIENAIVRELTKVDAVSAIFCEQDMEEGVLRVFVVVDEHEPETYEAVLEAEARISERLADIVNLDYRIRAHQRRQVRHVVPVGTNPIYVR